MDYISDELCDMTADRVPTSKSSHMFRNTTYSDNQTVQNEEPSLVGSDEMQTLTEL